MIEFLRGKVAYQAEESIACDVSGVGYRVFVHSPMRWLEGENVQLFTHLVVREDAQLLYGFSDQEERDLFRNMIEVSGIGPKAAMGMLSQKSPGELVAAIYNEDVVSLTQLPGIGKKTAMKIILELKDKLHRKGFVAGNVDDYRPIASTTSPSTLARDVIDALMGLGYNEKEAEQVVSQVGEEVQAELTTENWIKQSLQRFAMQR